MKIFPLAFTLAIAFSLSACAANLKSTVQVQSDKWKILLENRGPNYINVVSNHPIANFEKYIVDSKLKVYLGVTVYPKHITHYRLMAQQFKIQTIAPRSNLAIELPFGSTIVEYGPLSAEDIDWPNDLTSSAEIFVDYFECKSGFEYLPENNLSGRDIFSENASVLCDGKTITLNTKGLQTLKIGHQQKDDTK